MEGMKVFMAELAKVWRGGVPKNSLKTQHLQCPEPGEPSDSARDTERVLQLEGHG